jgi:hypothetical protein
MTIACAALICALYANTASELQKLPPGDPSLEVLQKARLHFADDLPSALLPAEEEFLRATARGDVAELGRPVPLIWPTGFFTGAGILAAHMLANDPANAAAWEPQRIIRADRISWLCTDPVARRFITSKGVRLAHARIRNLLDLSSATIPFNVSIEDCSTDAPIDLQHAHLGFLSLAGTSTTSIDARRLQTDDDVFLNRGFTARGSVDLSGATIGRALDCEAGCFLNANSTALNAERVHVGDYAAFSGGFRAEGTVVLQAASIAKDISFSGGTVNCPRGDAIIGDNVTIEGSVHFTDGFRATGGVRLTSAAIRRDLVCDGACFICSRTTAPGATPAFIAFDAESIKVDGSIFLREGFAARGEVLLAFATIGRNLECDGGFFDNVSHPDCGGDDFVQTTQPPAGATNARAINADGIKVEGHVFMRHGRNPFVAYGEVFLINAAIGQDLDCSGGQVLNGSGHALSADRVKVKGSVFLRNEFRAEGDVRFPGANIGGDLRCTGGLLDNGTGISLNASGVFVGGSVFCDNDFHSSGEVDLSGATVIKTLHWFKVNQPSDVTTLDLRSSDIRTLHFGLAKDLPARLLLHGLAYADFIEEHGEELRDVADRRRAAPDLQCLLQFLEKQPEFSPQPYEQLAKVLRAAGDEETAKSILIAKSRRTNDAEKSLPVKTFYWAWDKVSGFGYQPLIAVYWLSGFIVVGVVFFELGYLRGVLVEEQKDAAAFVDYPKFNPLAYSIESFVPVLSLSVAKYWLPSPARGRWGRVLRWYLWIHIFAGWAFAALIANAVYRVIQ